MTRFPLLLTALAAMSLATLAQAQETPEADAAAEPQAEAPAEPQADAPAAGAPQLDTGEPVGAQGSAQGAAQAEDNTYVKATHGDWDVQCLRVEQGEEPCQMYQLLRDSNDNSVSEVSLFKVQGQGNIAAGATFIVPLGTLLTEKLTIQVDSGQAKRYDLSFCTQIGCYARIGFTAAEVASFRAGQVARISIVPFQAPDQRVTVDMSLTGFTAAYNEITVLQQ
ncbi:invasion associated locus B family protein [Thalassococcus sp. BH17M4-6]|uniref:invasion associated locus B family protein n=1 Tax=Thalassococcus sp. BH17M4-6 TaxID=3413148 RepID=UPI003BD755AA